jgi:hypothetical protein
MKPGYGLVATLVLAGACAQQPPPSDLPRDLLTTASDFVEVPRSSPDDVASARQALGSGTVAVQDGDHNFYLAIRKTSLSQRWFLSAYSKQWFPGDVSFGFADFTLGTRVISFKIQNGKLFVFDASDQFKSSDLESPTILVEAWPVVSSPSFDRLPGADDYVLVDPSAGLNKFGVTGETFADPSLGSVELPFSVGLVFMQNFRTIADGATFEEVFSGDVDFGGGPSSAWGTLGLSLRKYSVGQGYTPTADPGTPFYFLSDSRLIPNSGDFTESNPVKFNFKKGMKPIEVQITQGAMRAQADFPDVDVLGAFKRGVETWNDVFGFPVFKAVFVNSDAVPDDDKSFVLVDYPGGAPFAFADWRSNPNNGETRGMSVYFSGAFFGDTFTDDGAGIVARPTQPKLKPVVHSLTWGGMSAQRPGCVYWTPAYREHVANRPDPGTHRTAQQKTALFIQHVLAHEVGHTLGLRHNFAGSLEPPSSSLMDYLDDFTDALELSNPGSYDREAIKYLYGLSPNLPTDHAFCTDETTAIDPVCQTFDTGANPLYDLWAGNMSFLVGLILDFGFDVSFLDSFYLNETLEFARDIGFVPPVQRTDAIHIALDRTQVPISAADAADPVIVAAANLVADKVLRRIVLDDPSLRGNVVADVTDPDVVALVASQAGRMLRNEDAIRTPQLRRTTVDVLKALQTDAAFLELRTSRAAIQAALDAGAVAGPEVPFVQDVLARVQVALDSYYN